MIDFDSEDEVSVSKVLMPITGFTSDLRGNISYRVIMAVLKEDDCTKLALCKKQYELCQYSTFEEEVFHGLVDPDFLFLKVDEFDLTEECTYNYVAEDVFKLKASVLASKTDLSDLTMETPPLVPGQAVTLRTHVYESLAKPGKVNFAKIMMTIGIIPRCFVAVIKEGAKMSVQSRPNNQNIVKFPIQNESTSSMFLKVWNLSDENQHLIEDGKVFLVLGAYVEHGEYGSTILIKYGGVTVLPSKNKNFSITYNFSPYLFFRQKTKIFCRDKKSYE